MEASYERQILQVIILKRHEVTFVVFKLGFVSKTIDQLRLHAAKLTMFW